jgi:ribonuclease R
MVSPCRAPPATTRTTGLWPACPTGKRSWIIIATQKTSVGKREIAKAFGLHAQDKIALKALLKEMMEAGELETGPGRNLHKGGGLPKVTVIRICDVADGVAIAVPDRWEHATPPPRLRVIEPRRRAVFGLGDRLLARIEEQGGGLLAFPMKALAKSEEFVLGILRKEALGWRLVPVDKKARTDLAINDPGDGQPGDLVLAEPSGRPPRQYGRVVEVLGDPFQPKSFSLIAIHAKGIPNRFDESTLDEAERMARQSLGDREDLRALPFLTIDPADARDHDDAVWAAPDDEKPGPFPRHRRHRRCQLLRPPRHRARPFGAQPRQQRLFPRSRRADAARSAFGARLQPGGE